ncbi:MULTISPECIES: GNAT family N-acetyltransferase [unclassified Sinorhizobium]|uniref:GNAT family N-acetyltransferase n=1 Tax=unclassified Sinorhizobium TaxID=2613772 RepID=UPI0035249354
MDFDAVKQRRSALLRSSCRLAPNLVHIETAFGRHEVTLEQNAGTASLMFYHGDPIGSGDILLAAAEAITAEDRSIRSVVFDKLEKLLPPNLASRGMLDAGVLWQWPLPWLPEVTYPFPPIKELTNGRYHPRRPAKPTGLVYRRFIPWLERDVAFRVADLEADLASFHRWMNDEQVNAIWEDSGDIDRHREILAARIADPHVLPLIGMFGDIPFGYFEVYWAKEDRLGPFYDADDYDRGWHVAIGEPAYRGKRWISAWLPSLMHFIFLDDPRTQRVVGEPRASHEQQIRNLDRSGFAKIKHFDFPHKRALLVMLTRERFFGDHLWVPAS